MITTTLQLSHDRCNWTTILKRDGIWSYPQILYEARDVLDYYRSQGESIYTRVSYTHSTAGQITYKAVAVEELDAQAAIAEAERIIKGK